MAISASLPGRLRNTSLPKSHALLPLFEAVVNSIQSIDDAFTADVSAGRIEIEVLRAPQLALDVDQLAAEPIVGFVVRDNGEGFHDLNMASFEMLDSEHKASRGGRGVGRLMWLKAFDRVEVRSTYRSGAEWIHRSFAFSSPDGVRPLTFEHLDGPRAASTEVMLGGFDETYRQSAPKTLGILARSVLEHCLWYFVRNGGAPQIVVRDSVDEFNLDNLYHEYMPSSAQAEEFELKGRHFTVLHLRLKASPTASPQLNWCAANRVVVKEGFAGKVPGLHGKLRDGDLEFVYSCFLVSPYLDRNVRPERTEFDIPETSYGAIDQSDPSRSEIRSAVIGRSAAFLEEYLAEVKLAARERVTTFAHNHPRYRALVQRLPEDKFSIDPGMSDRDLELHLHKELVEQEIDVVREGQEVLDMSTDPGEQFQERLRGYLEKVEELKKSDLAAYVARRKVILEVLAALIRVDAAGKYSKEDAIHNLIMPMRKTSNDVVMDACNLWLIDERLAFHDYLASDKPLSAMPITGDTSRIEPDLLALQTTDGPMLVSETERVPLASIVVVEVKRPMRNDAASGVDKDPIEQSLRYLRRVREGGVLTSAGRPIPPSEKIPGYIYVLTDLTRTMRERCDFFDLMETPDRLGYFGYNSKYEAYIEVISFDRLLTMAGQRNRAFFDKLGLPAT